MKNITYINAGAGSGKTYRLTEEMLHRVRDGHCSPSQIIASTFTTEAAADLKAKAREKFLENGLYAQAAELDSAAIGTVHAIGLLYIRRYWYKLGLSASVEILDEESKATYVNRTLALEAGKDDLAAFRAFADHFEINLPMTTRRNYDFWKSLLKDLVDKADTFGVAAFDESLRQSLDLAQKLIPADGQPVYLECVRRIFDIAGRWRQRFESYKKDHGLIEYNDMENRFLELLDDAEVQADIRASVKYVFVDEFQDSNPKQIRIFDRLSDLVEHSWWVGDPKQAIYGFRGCDTVLVQALTSQIVEDADQGKPGMAYESLGESFRSVKPLVDMTNTVFCKVFDQLPRDMVALTAHRTELPPDGVPALWHWEQVKTQEPGKKRLSASKEKLHKSLARQIRLMVDGKDGIRQVFDKDAEAWRPVRSSDIAVLARSNSDVEAIAAALRTQGLPVAHPQKVGVDRTEVQLVRLLLSWLLNPSSPLLRAELSHLMFDQPVEDLLRSDAAQLLNFDNELYDLDSNLDKLPVADVVQRLVVQLDLLHRSARWGRGAERRRNLLALIEDAKTFDAAAAEAGRASSIELYIEHLDTDGIVVGEGFAPDGVQVKTYHDSKGLQWPVVVLCGLDNNPADQKKAARRFAFGVNCVRCSDPAPGDLYSDFYLLCLPSVHKAANTNLDDDQMAVLNQTPAWNRHFERTRQEEMRLLYVGVTRARDYLVTTSQEGGEVKWLMAAGLGGKVEPNVPDQPIWGGEAQVAFSRVVRIGGETDCLAPPEEETYQYRPVAELVEATERSTGSATSDKYLSPSRLVPEKLPEAKVERVFPAEGPASRPVSVGRTDDYDLMGTCIHNIFAVYRPDTPADAMRAKAQRIINAHGMSEVLPRVDEVLGSVSAFYAFMERTYGPACRIEREWPFSMPMDGQLLAGEIDLVWILPGGKDCVLVDFKNFPGALSELLLADGAHYAGRYAPQLGAYARALSGAGLQVKDKLLYYAVLGVVLRVE